MLWFWLFAVVMSVVGVVVASVVARRTPAPRLGPWAAVRRQYVQYATTGGRASRSEYWWPWLLYLLLDTALQGAALPLERGGAHVVEVLRAAVAGVAMLPGLAVTARRLHDTGRSAWWASLLLTVVGIPWVLWWLSRPSQPRPNPYGPAPGTSLWLPEVEGEERPWTTTGPPRSPLLWSATTLVGAFLWAVGDVATSLEQSPDSSSGWVVLSTLVGGLLLAVGVIALRGAPLFATLGRSARRRSPQRT